MLLNFTYIEKLKHFIQTAIRYTIKERNFTLYLPQHLIMHTLFAKEEVGKFFKDSFKAAGKQYIPSKFKDVNK